MATGKLTHFIDDNIPTGIISLPNLVYMKLNIYFSFYNRDIKYFDLISLFGCNLILFVRVDTKL
jgi:hypothetical protein